eukprot:3948862-Pleurochrysis_carterae.AAC.1
MKRGEGKEKMPSTATKMPSTASKMRTRRKVTCQQQRLLRRASTSIYSAREASEEAGEADATEEAAESMRMQRLFCRGRTRLSRRVRRARARQGVVVLDVAGVPANLREAPGVRALGSKELESERASEQSVDRQEASSSSERREGERRMAGDGRREGGKE